MDVKKGKNTQEPPRDKLMLITPFLKLYIKLFLPSNNSQNVLTLINRYFKTAYQSFIVE